MSIVSAVPGWPVTRLATFGQSAPVDTPAAKFASLFTPIVNVLDDVAFSGLFRSDNGASGNGFFKGAASGLTAIAFDPFDSSLVGTVTATLPPAVFNANDTAAYIGFDRSGTVGVALKPANGAVTFIAKAQDAIPGMAGGVFNDFQLDAFTLPNLNLNLHDDVVFLARFTNHTGFHQGVFLKPHDGPIRLVASDETPMTANRFFICNNPDVTTVNRVWVNNQGDVAFFTQICGAGPGPSSAIMMQLVDGSFVELPLSGVNNDQAPSPLAGTVIGVDMGMRGFRVRKGQPSWAMNVFTNANQAVVAQTLGSRPAVRAIGGAPAPGTNGTFGGFLQPQLGSGDGKVAFVAFINGDPRMNFGVYLSTPDGVLWPVAFLTTWSLNEGPQPDQMSINQLGHIVFQQPGGEGGLFLAKPKGPQAGSINFISDTSWAVTNLAGASLGFAQMVCLNPSYPPNCPPGAMSYGYPGAGWTTDTSSIPGATRLWAPGITGGTAPAFPADYLFSKSFTIPGSPTAGSISIAVDDFAQVIVNGTSVGTIGSVSDVSLAANASASLHTFDITAFLVSGTNNVTIHAANGNFGCGSGPYNCNPAGVVFGGTLQFKSAIP